ncbi:MAG: hypothetical protein EXR61_02300 [Chloroflexi bacterium]|nr:hypothetical protein [Chloroflexota bacterium]
MGLGFAGVLIGMMLLGFRHGFDWDHLAAITDITSTVTAGHADADVSIASPMPVHGHDEHPAPTHGHPHKSAGRVHTFVESRWAHEERHAVGLASLYALGHALVVVLLGTAALLLNAILPEWVDPILQRVVGVTLVVLGMWVLVSVVQYLRGKGEFRLRSRWMVVFDGARYLWGKLQSRIHGHAHMPTTHATQYGPKTAFGVGLIHGIGAETGSQALLIAGVAGATRGIDGVVILLAFVVGLLASNTLVAVVSAGGFIGAQRLRTVYVIVGAFAGVASLVIGLVFLAGAGSDLPDLQELIFGGS